MAVDKKISQLASGAPAQAGDEYVVARSGANYKLTLTNIAASMPPIGATTPNTGAFTTLSASGVFTAKNGGSAATPDITTSGDTNTGIFFPAADTIAFCEGGSEVLRINSSGNVGVGTTSPSGRMTVSEGNKVIDGTGNFNVFTTNAQAANFGGQIALGGLNGSAGAFDPWSFATIKGAKENSTSGNLAGYLAFATPNSGGALSEKMRIDSSGNVGIGGTAANAATKVEINGTLPTSSNFTLGYDVIGTIPSGTTNSYYGYRSSPSTAAASFTVTNLDHFRAQFSSAGAGSAVTNQIGFHAASSLTGATNNYGFYGNIASGSNRYNVYMAGTADNYFAGNVGIGTASPACKLDINTGASTGTTDMIILGGLDNGSAKQTYGVVRMGIENNTASAEQGNMDFQTVESGTIRNRIQINGSGYIAFSNGGTERMRIDSSGNVGIGGTASAFAKVQKAGTLPTSSNISVGDYITGTIPSGSTSAYYGYYSAPTTQATSFTCGAVIHYYTNPQAFGAGSTVTNQYGYYAESTLTGATNNYGFFSNIASGSNRWNFYAAGTANNYFAGRVGIGVTPTYALHVESTATEASRSFRLAYDSTYYLDIIQKGAGGAFFRSNNGEFVFNVTGTDYARLTTAGEFITGGTTDQGAYNLQCNGTGVWGAGAYVNGSDARLKDDITTLNDGLNVVSQLRPVTFKYKPDYSKDQNVQTGFIAQELQTALAGKDYVDGIVQAGPNHLNVAYQSLIPILVKAIQELTARVAELEAK